MVDDVTMFWLIHLFLGVVVPLMIFFNCCGLRDIANNKEETNEFYFG